MVTSSNLEFRADTLSAASIVRIVKAKNFLEVEEAIYSALLDLFEIRNFGFLKITYKKNNWSLEDFEVEKKERLENYENLKKEAITYFLLFANKKFEKCERYKSFIEKL